MKVKLICVGKTTKNFLVDGEKEYEKRLKKYISYEQIVINDVKNAKKLSQELIRSKEGEMILEKLLSSDFVVLLDEKGKAVSSTGFANYMQQKFNSGGKQIVFIVGGPYGFSEAVYSRANDKLALSKMTFSHQMVRLFFVEQLYRAMSILNNDPYHHE